MSEITAQVGKNGYEVCWWVTVGDHDAPLLNCATVQRLFWFRWRALRWARKELRRQLYGASDYPVATIRGADLVIR